MKLRKYAIPFAAVGLMASGPLFAQSDQDQSQQSGGQASEQQGQNGSSGQNGQNQSSGSEQQGSQQNQASNQGSAASPGNQMASAQDVRKVQNYLQQKGYNVKVDGIWGPKTSDAVKQFQQQNNLQATGQLDQQTLAQMNIQPSGQQRAPASQGGSGGNQGTSGGGFNSGGP